MHYLICFVFSFLILLWIMSIEDNLRPNALLLTLTMVVGDGGYCALYYADNLQTALLANLLTYVIGIFAPMLLLFNVCDICRIKMPYFLKISLCTLQSLLYLSVSTSGHYPLFYKSVEFHKDFFGSYLVKTYGFAHSLYLITVIAYLIAIAILCFNFGNKRNRLSIHNIDMIIVFFFLILGSYMVERIIHLRVELVPFVYTIGTLGILIPIVRYSSFSIDTNMDIMEAELDSNGYVIFTKSLKYMGCNDIAAKAFPEFYEWELEKKIPGNGGRFNTFLRPAFMKFVNGQGDDGEKPENIKTFGDKDKKYCCEFLKLHKRDKDTGYIIKIVDLNKYTYSKTRNT